MPGGEAIEVDHRVPLFTLARRLEERGYGEWMLQAFTPGGTRDIRVEVTL